jgi:hypothetical protein
MKILLQKTFRNAWALFKIMIPVVILIKIAIELNILTYLSYPFEPLMYFLGLPKEYAIVWIGAIANTNYTAFALITMLYQNYPINVEQLTSISLLCLICHSIIIESIIAKETGVNPIWAGSLRFFSAIIAVYFFHIFCQTFNLLQYTSTSTMLTNVTKMPTIAMEYINQGTFLINYKIWLIDILYWVFSQLKMVVLIICIIFIIFLFVKLLTDFKIVDKINRFLYIIFQLIRIKKENTLIVFLCFIVGLSYGWGILREESQTNNNFKGEQAFKIISFLSISHAMIEDVIIFSLLGGSFITMFSIRFFLSFFVVAILSFLILPKLNDMIKHRIFFYK